MNTTAIVTGAAGLVGSEAVRFLSAKGLRVIGIDNNMRQTFFGSEASTDWNRRELESLIPGYIHHSADIRHADDMASIFSDHSSDIGLVIHAAAQPSHDWAARDPLTDFTINANGTLELLECTRRYAPAAVFIFTSTNKVYGDNPNKLPLVELDTRWELEPSHAYFDHGIDESMSVDQTTHSLFGVSKLAADALVQEYGRYFGISTGCFRGGCLTGPAHSGTRLHGFLSYLMRCAITGDRYTIYGYRGKQVRDNIHSSDLVNMFWQFYQKPRAGEVYNAGGGRFANCSLMEAMAACERMTGKRLNIDYSDESRVGDHKWYISDTRKFQNHFPEWRYCYDLEATLSEIHDSLVGRLKSRGDVN